MEDNSRWDKIEKTLEDIYCIVVRIEKNHGAMLDALLEGQARMLANFADRKVVRQKNPGGSRGQECH
ncbi:MAG: hypothetical protein JRJ19_12680 [Deltaproteobacteria bacterium]|nr:hypothetical protein [Deltaproteobacteria bacterium]MBW1872918.1 hypothetical protein [Deltaproteobacteria bacterium]